jgi:MFS family permease
MRARWSASSTVLGIICLMYFITYIDRVNISTAAPVIAKELGLSNTQLGLAFSAFAYPYALFQIFGGWLGDRFGARRTLGICGLVWSAATMATGLITGLASLFIARLALGFGEGAAFPTATRAMANWLPAERRGFAQGITHSFARMGNAVTPPIIVGLMAVLSWRGSFLIMGAVSALWVAVWVWYFRDSPREHRGMTEDELAALPDAAAKGRRTVPWLPLVRRILPVTAVDFCYGWTLWVYLTWIPSFFVHEYHLELKSSAFFTSGVLWAGVIGDTLGGIVSDRILRRTGSLSHARRDVIVVGFLGCFASTLPVLFVHDLTVAAVSLSAAFFFAELIVGPVWAVPMDIAPDYAGSASGFMNLGFGLAGIISPVVFGAIIDASGSWSLPFFCSVALLLVGAALAFFMRPEVRFTG